MSRKKSLRKIMLLWLLPHFWFRRQVNDWKTVASNIKYHAVGAEITYLWAFRYAIIVWLILANSSWPHLMILLNVPKYNKQKKYFVRYWRTQIGASSSSSSSGKPENHGKLRFPQRLSRRQKGKCAPQSWLGNRMRCLICNVGPK